MFLDLLEKTTDAEKDDKGQMKLIADNKNNADKTLVHPVSYTHLTLPTKRIV